MSNGTDPLPASGIPTARVPDQRANSLLDATASPSCAVDARGTIVAVNAAWLAFTSSNGGDQVHGGIGVNYLRVCDKASGPRSEGASTVAYGLREVLAGSVDSFELNYPCDGPSEQRWFSVRVAPQREGSGAVISHHDITALKLVELGLSRQALRDELTDLPNRALLTDRLDQALAEGSRSGRLVAVACLRLDQLTQIGDRHGESIRDSLVIEVATRLTRQLRDGDTLARFADDKLVVVWRDLSAVQDAHDLSRQLVQALDGAFTVSGHDITVTATVGVSIDQWAQTAEELLLAADAAVTDARRRSPGIVQVFAPEPGTPLVRPRTEANLREALHRNELVLHYQPVVDLTSGACVGVEALVRWQHPIDGLLPPDQFIPVAEAGGLIVALGEWVLEEACAQAARWRAQGLPLEMAVNLSTRQVAHPDLVRTVLRVLHETGLDPRDLVLEVTESAVMEDAEAAVTVLSALAGLGVSLAIDDFGTGYSSLTYLKRYPIRALKVDRLFVAGMGLSEEDDAIVASVVGLARAVGGVCIAEGVETQEQYAALRELGCGLGQGWLFGRAVPAAELPGLVAHCETSMAALLPEMPPPGQRDKAGAKRDRAAEQRDNVADERDVVSDQRDLAGDARDQVGDRRDHAGDARDQAADQRDQAGERRDRAADERDQVGELRDEEGERRDRAGDERDQAADERDQAAEQRDHAAEKRDRAADQRDQAAESAEAKTPSGAPADTVGRSVRARQDAAMDRSRASSDRRAGATERTQAERDRGTALADRGAGAGQRWQAERDRGTALADRGAGAGERSQAERDRGTALADRGAGASQRSQAEHDREVSLADRSASAIERESASIDGLTGAYTRDAGVCELEREMARVRRAEQPLTLAFVNVAGPRATPDGGGNTQHDCILAFVATTLRSGLRAYDLVIRYRGDEFVCVLAGMGEADAAKRIGLIEAAFAEQPDIGSVTVGFSELRAADGVEDVVSRADAASRRQPHQ